MKKFEMCTFVFKDLNHNQLFNFQSHSDVHNYFTRNRHNLDVGSVHTRLAFNFILYDGLRMFNTLEDDIRNAIGRDIFKYRLKYYFLSQYLSEEFFWMKSGNSLNQL